MKVVAVRWLDAHADVSGWTSMTGPHDPDPYEIVTIGIALDKKSGKKPGHRTRRFFHINIHKSAGTPSNKQSTKHYN